MRTNQDFFFNCTKSAIIIIPKENSFGASPKGFSLTWAPLKLWVSDTATCGLWTACLLHAELNVKITVGSPPGCAGRCQTLREHRAHLFTTRC